MPPVSDFENRTSSIRYTAVDNEQAHESSDAICQTNVADIDDLTRQSNTTLDNESSARSSSPNSKSTEPSIQKANLLSSESTAPVYKGPNIAGWPSAPRKLSGFSVPLFVGDALLILFPVAFLTLGITAWSLNGKELSKTGTTVQSAMNLGPTIYPLAFAAIGSRCFRNIAVRLAERGTTIATLEKLLGSQSLVSAVGTAVNLRSLSFLSLSMVLLWGLSPLGGQSSLRLLHEWNSTVSEPGIVYYSDHNAPFDPYETTAGIRIAPAILAASLASSQETKALPVDLWNHPKVPRLDIIEQLSLRESTDVGEWIAINSTAARYTSWSGINVQNIRRTGSVSFEARYNYMHLNCSVLYSGDGYTVWKNMSAPNLATYPPVSTTDPGNDSQSRGIAVGNMTELPYAPNMPSLSMFFKVAYSSKDGKLIDKDAVNGGFELYNQSISYLYGANYLTSEETRGYEHALVHQCAPKVTTMDVQIICKDGNCAAARLRYVPGAPRSELAPSCDRRYTTGCMSSGTHGIFPFIRHLPLALMSPIAGNENAFDAWIGGDDLTYPGYTDAVKNPLRVATEISAEKLSERLTILLNTFYQSATWGPQITRAGLFEKPDLADDGTHSFQTAPERHLNTTEAMFYHSVPRYRANVVWIITLLLISTILFILSVANIVISFMTIAPDLFYYASSLARENPYTDTPDGGTAMDGGERSRLLRAMRVQIADVSPDRQVGYVVFKSLADDDDCEMGRLKKDRLYR